MGMFNTAVGSGYGYDSVRRQGAPQIRQSNSDGYAGSSADRSWSDATVPINQSSGTNAMNFQGSYTPTGAGGGAFNNFYGSGMWLSSPVDQASGEPIAGCTTLAAGATFTMDYKIVATQRSQAQFRAENGWESTDTLPAAVGGNIDVGGKNIATNGVSESLSWSDWSIGTTTWRLSDGTDKTLYVGTGRLTFTTDADLTVCNGGTDDSPTVQYTQLMLTPPLFTVAGLGNGTMLYCSTLAYTPASSTISTTVDGVSREALAELGTVQTMLRAEFD